MEKKWESDPEVLGLLVLLRHGSLAASVTGPRNHYAPLLQPRFCTRPGWDRDEMDAGRRTRAFLPLYTLVKSSLLSTSPLIRTAIEIESDHSGEGNRKPPSFQNTTNFKTFVQTVR